MAPRTILGIESSCDDSAAAILRGEPGAAEILSSVVEGQAALHSAYGGVVPELAARAHAERLDHCIEAALREAGETYAGLDAIAVTSGPGLIGGLISGVMCARGLAAATGLPVIGVNHLAGHALTPRLTDGVAFPYLMLLVSGGHCQLLELRGPGDYARLGGTIDDAPGEAFDKVARTLGLTQPGGPSVEAVAMAADPGRIPLPRPLLDREGCDMSFSGLKTAVIRARDAMLDETGALSQGDRADLCAAFQRAVAEVLAEKTRRAIAACATPPSCVAVAGGVAANGTIRAALADTCKAAGVEFVAPPLALCTDNAAMIAYAGLEMLGAGLVDPGDLTPRPRWPLDRDSAPMLGAGKRGAKA